jgi:enterobactin synthetase component F
MQRGVVRLLLKTLDGAVRREISLCSGPAIAVAVTFRTGTGPGKGSDKFIMTGLGLSSFPLTTAQRGIWVTQKITPDANMNIAEAVEIRGPINPETFRRALRQLVSEAEELRVGIVEEAGKPRQILRLTYPCDFPYLDMSSLADPEQAAHAWMTDELSRPIDLARDPLWFSALLKTGEDRYFWYQRAHHIVYDGYGGGLVARRLADIYTAYARGSQPQPNCFCTVEAMVTAEATYRGSDRFRRDREYWHQQLSNLPDTVTLSHSRKRHRLSSRLHRSIGSLSVGTVRQLREIGEPAAGSDQSDHGLLPSRNGCE